MNRFRATIERVEKRGELQAFDLRFEDLALRMFCLQPTSTLKPGTEVVVGVKPTQVMIAKGCAQALGCMNRIEAVVDSLECGELLCNLELSYRKQRFEAVVAAEAVSDLKLYEGDSLTLFFSENALFIAEVCGD